MTKEDWLNLWRDMVRSAANVDCLSYPDDDYIIEEDDDDFFNDLYYDDLYYDDLYGEYL